MTQQQGRDKTLGELLKQRREVIGMTLRQVEEASGSQFLYGTSESRRL